MTNFEYVIYVLISCFSTVLICSLQSKLFRESPIREDPNSPASFYPVESLLRSSKFRLISWLYTMPVGLLFLITCLQSGQLVRATFALLNAHVIIILKEEYQKLVKELFNTIPEFMYPLVILFFGLMLFAPIIRKVSEIYRDLVHYVLGIRQRADYLALSAAIEVLKKYGSNFDTVVKKIRNSSGEDALDVPEKLRESSLENRVAYLLIYINVAEIKIHGLLDALAKTASNLNVPVGQALSSPEGGASKRSNYIYAAAALVFYSVLCFIYIVLTPFLAPWVESNPALLSLMQPIEWPRPEFRNILALELLENSLAFVVPLAFGLILYAHRRQMASGQISKLAEDEDGTQRDEEVETPFQSFGVVFSLQFFFAVIVKIIFTAFWAAQRLNGELQGVFISFAEIKPWVNIVLPAIAPGLALLALISCLRMGIGRSVAFLIVALTSALAFLLCAFAYEAVALNFRGLYWHQMSLGGFLTISYYVAGLIAKDILVPDLETSTENKNAEELAVN